MRKLIRHFLGLFGLELRRRRLYAPGTQGRPVGDMFSVLEDMRARGLVVNGIIDVGANRGEWTQMALSLFPEATVLMIEPQDEMIQPLKELCAQNPRLEHVHAGAGRASDKMLQTIWPDLAGSSFLPAEDKTLLATGKQRLTPIVTIDSLMASRPALKPDLMKLDIQGFELEAIAGAMLTCGSVQIIIAEVSLFEFMPGQPLLRDVINVMATLDFEFYDIAGIGRRPVDGALGQIDIVFVRKDHHLRSSNAW